MTFPTPLSDFVNNYDDQEHIDLDDFVIDPFYDNDEDDFEILDDEWDIDGHEGLTREQWDDWLENGP